MPKVAIDSASINAQRKSGHTPARSGEKLKWQPATKKKIAQILSRYPKEQSRSATIPVLWLAQQEFGGWVSVDAMELVAETLNLPYIRVYEVATFYTMFNLKPVGEHHVQVCTNCSCMIRGSDKIVSAVKDFTGISKNGQTSADGKFTFTEVECLGACVDAPMMQINTHYYTNLTEEKTAEILAALAEGKNPPSDTERTEIDPVVYAPKAKAAAKKGAK